MEKNKLAIVISTYKREDGKSPFYLNRALDSIKKQTYQNFKIFLIGDKYENPKEIEEIINNLNLNSLYFENLPFAKEREKYTGNQLWSYGGVNAINHGIRKSLNEGFELICHLDHDDWWENNHLELINECINLTNSDWICTKSTYTNPNNVLPKMFNNELHINFLPRFAGLIHSSVCMNFKKIPLLYRDIFDETGSVGLPSDADLWERCREFIIKNNLKSTLINKITCHHDEEGYERSKRI
jgi:glycosyltransferase involved in cell wall biosynthesis